VDEAGLANRGHIQCEPARLMKWPALHIKPQNLVSAHIDMLTTGTLRCHDFSVVV
jgi:hypothetical protein